MGGLLRAIAVITGVMLLIARLLRIVLAIVASLLELVRRQYSPKDYLVSLDSNGEPTFQDAVPGSQSAPGLIVFRFDAELFYANANRFVDHIQSLIGAAPDPVRWFVLDAGSLTDVDYSAGLSLGHLLDYLKARGITFALARADDALLDTLEKYGLMEQIEQARVYGNLTDAVAAFQTH